MFCSYLYTLVNICICVTPRPVVTGQVSAHQLSLLPQQSSVWAEQSIAGQGTAEQCALAQQSSGSTHCVFRKSWESICKASLVLYQCNILCAIPYTDYQIDIYPGSVLLRF